jgi:plasmid replication initiation protein
VKDNKKKLSEIVVYRNDFNTVNLGDFTKNELNFLMAVLVKMYGKESNTVIFTFEELRKLSNWRRKDKKEFINGLDSTNDKLMLKKIKMINESKKKKFILFPMFEIDEKEETLTVEISSHFINLLNNLKKDFTEFELENFTHLKSKYSQLIYKQLMQFKSTGNRIFKLKDFVEVISIPDSYCEKKIDDEGNEDIEIKISLLKTRILDPTKKELEKILKDFNYNFKSLGKKVGKGRKKFTHIEFSFKPISNLKNVYDDAEVIEIIESNNNENPIEETERIEILIEILEEKIAAEENKINRLTEQIKEFKEKEYIDAADESINKDIENYLENNVIESNKKIMEYKKEIEDYKNQLNQEVVEDYNSLIEKILKEKNVYTKEVKEKISSLKETNTDEEIYKEILNKIEEIKTKNIKNVSGYLNTCIKNLEIKKIEVIEKKDITPAEEVNKEKIEELGLINLLNKYKQ